MSIHDSKRSKFALHGPAVEIACEVPAMADQVERLLSPFKVHQLPEGFSPTLGIIRPYLQSEVMKHLSPGAKPVQSASDLIEIYEEGDRYWDRRRPLGHGRDQHDPRPVPKLDSQQSPH